ncbi:MAG: hypothetical protein ACK5KM_16015 [Hyphomicrobiaceae bacterium]
MTKQMRVEIERLQHLVDVYGGDPERWPTDERAQMLGFASTDQEAAALVAQARALDSVLDKAPLMDEARLISLSQQIVATAMKEGRWVGEGGTAEDVGKTALAAGGDRHRRQRQSVSRSLPALPSGWFSGLRRGPVASLGMLAASFAIGIIAGTTVMSNSEFIWPALEQNVAVAGTGEGAEIQQFELGDEGFDQIVEELL